MHTGYQCITASFLQGSCTACVVLLDGSKLRTANLGDSGFMVLRKDQIQYVSRAQQHSFNFPYQLAGPKCSGDDPLQAEVRPLCSLKADKLLHLFSWATR